MKKFSKQRELILNSLKSRKDHPTAETLFWDLKKEMTNLGIATIYRNLQNLYKEGEIAKIKTKDGIDRYDGNIKPHIHFECLNCGKVSDVFLEKEQQIKLDNDIQKLGNKIEANYINAIILLTGYCKECKNDTND